MVTSAQRARRRAAARTQAEAPATEQPTEQPTEEATATESTEATTAKPKRVRKPRVVPDPVVEEPTEPEAPARSYTAWTAPADKEAALVMLRPPKGRGLILELQQAHDRVVTNRGRKDAGPTAPNTTQAIGWHDRTMAKVITAIGIANTAALKRELADLMERSAKLTGSGTKAATTKPGKAALAVAEAAAARKRPARTSTRKSAAA